MYDGSLGRFAQADTIVPLESQGVQAWDRYAYVNNNPVRYNDPSGHWVESALDIAFIAYDIYDISTNGLNWENSLSLAADVAGLILPAVTGGGLAVRALIHADDAVKVVNKIDNVLDAANAIDNVVDAGNAADNLADVAKAADNLPKKPFSNPSNRPSYSSNQVETVWENAKQADGNVYDPYTGEQLSWDRSKPRNGQWDMGHTPDHQYQDLWKKYMNGEIGYDEFMRQYRDPGNYFPQSVNSNRSRRHDPR